MARVSAKHHVARLVALLLASLFVAVVGFKAIAVYPSFFIEDDAWFYLEIGHNLGTLHRSTFDQINTTSGYHLCWGAILGLLSAVTSLFSPDKCLFLIISTAVYLFCGLIAAEYFGRNMAEKLALLFLVFYSKMLMETQLLATLLLFVCHCVLRERKTPWVYVAVVLIPLVRVDAAMILLPLLLYYLLRRDFDAFGKLCGSLVLGMAAHLLLMGGLFGHLASASSLLKAWYFDQLGVSGTVALNVTGYMRNKVVIFLALLVLSTIGACTSKDRDARLRSLVVIAGPALFTLFHVLFNPGLRDWYLSPALFVFALVLLRCEAKAPRGLFLVLVCLLVVREVRSAHRFYADDAATLRTEKIHLFLDEVRRIVPQDEAIYQVDGAGFTGFFSQRKIVNGDGLVNSYFYLDRLKADRLADYLRDNHIKYVITTSPIDGPHVIDFHGLVVSGDDVEKMAESGLDERFQALVLWKIKESYFDCRRRLQSAIEL